LSLKSCASKLGTFAERVVEGLFARYAAAERAVGAEVAAERERRLAKLVGSSVAVPLISFREAFPEVWASLKAIYELRQSARPVCGETVDP